MLTEKQPLRGRLRLCLGVQLTGLTDKLTCGRVFDLSSEVSHDIFSEMRRLEKKLSGRIKDLTLASLG
jgi:hypothetical protein